MLPRMRSALPAILSLACACAGSSAAKPDMPPPAQVVLAPAPAAAPGSRPLATFDDLVREAAARAARNEQAATGPCLLAPQGSAFTLSAALLPALAEFAETPADLDPLLERNKGPLRALTAWGQAGAIQPELAFAAFTALSPQSLRAPVIGIALTDRGAYLRYGDRPASDADGPIANAAVIPRLLAHPESAQAVLYVTAEAELPLGQLAELLRLLPHGRPVAFAQLLPEGTLLPPLAEANAPARMCPDGLPDLPGGSVEGDLATEAVVAALAPLRESASACLANATGPARAGGRITLALRVAPDGSITETCLVQDGIADASLAECVLSSARTLRMPAPNPPGFVDVHVPLELAPVTEPVQQPLCE